MALDEPPRPPGVEPASEHPGAPCFPSHGLPYRRLALGLAALVILGLLLFLYFTMFAGPSIADITRRPSAYDGKTVTVRGTVTRPLQIPMVGGGYQLEDRGGNGLLVLSRDVPPNGTRATVTGTVNVVAQLGSTKMVVLRATAADAGP